jgi:hypothetical protein
LTYLKGGKDHLSHISLLFGPDDYNQKDHLEGEYFAGNEAEYGSTSDFLLGVDQDPAPGPNTSLFYSYKQKNLKFFYKIAEVTKGQQILL